MYYIKKNVQGLMINLLPLYLNLYKNHQDIFLSDTYFNLVLNTYFKPALSHVKREGLTILCHQNGTTRRTVRSPFVHLSFINIFFVFLSCILSLFILLSLSLSLSLSFYTNDSLSTMQKKKEP